MLRDWLYERDAPTILARRNEAYAALHSEIAGRRFAWTLDSLEHALERVLRAGPIRERLDSLPLSRDPVTPLIRDFEEAVADAIEGGDAEIFEAVLAERTDDLLRALEAACAQDEFPRPSWTGVFAPNAEGKRG